MAVKTEQQNKPNAHLPPSQGNPRFVLYPESDDYDYVARRNIPKPTNVIESTAHIVKACLAASIMSMHVAYMKAGLWIALITSFLCGLIITYNAWTVVHSAQILYKRLHVTLLSYPDLMEASIQMGPFPKFRRCSKIFRYAVDVLICTDLFGSCCVYEIIISRSIVQLIMTGQGKPILDEKGHAINEDTTQVRIYVVVILFPILILCMIRTLKYLAPFSIVGNFCVVVTVISTVYYAMSSKTRKSLNEMPVLASWSGFFEFTGVIVFSIECFGTILPIENNMKDSQHFPIALGGGMTIVVCFISTVGFFGFWGFGDNCKAPVTLNLPTDTYPTILKGLMAFVVYVTFAINYWPPFNLVWFYISNKHDKRKHWIWERVYRAMIIVLITCVALAFPQIISLMGLLGGICSCNTAFIFPAIINTLVIWEKPGLGPRSWRLVRNILMAILGIFLGITSTYFNAKQLFFAKQVS